jgi:AraC-like DNA-binding protein
MPRLRRTQESSSVAYARALALIKARCGEFDLAPGAVAAELGCSTRVVQRIFALSGTTFRAELTDARMERGARELASGRSVAASAWAAGYRHPRHFARAFKRHHLISPGAVRRAGVVAARLRKRPGRAAPPVNTPAFAKHFKRWRADHGMLVGLLRGRRRPTALDGLFADALRLRGPDLRTADGKRYAASLARPAPERRSRHGPVVVRRVGDTGLARAGAPPHPTHRTGARAG